MKVNSTLKHLGILKVSYCTYVKWVHEFSEKSFCSFVNKKHRLLESSNYIVISRLCKKYEIFSKKPPEKDLDNLFLYKSQSFSSK